MMKIRSYFEKPPHPNPLPVGEGTDLQRLLNFIPFIAYLLPLFIFFHIHASFASEKPFDYSSYASVLTNYVDESGGVNYKGLKADRGGLDLFVRSTALLDRAEYEEWEENAKLAFWINAYNALTLKVVLDNYPIQGSFFASLRYPKNSIQHIPGVWDRIQFSVMGDEMTLDGIESEFIRKKFKEPRIHLALARASKGCPPLRNEPYRGDRLDEQLGQQVRASLSNPKQFRIDERAKVLYISRIFEWRGEDFVEKYRDDNQPAVRSKKQKSVIHFLSLYADDVTRTILKSYQYRVAYIDYDWSLNERIDENDG